MLIQLFDRLFFYANPPIVCFIEPLHVWVGNHGVNCTVLVVQIPFWPVFEHNVILAMI